MPRPPGQTPALGRGAVMASQRACASLRPVLSWRQFWSTSPGTAQDRPSPQPGPHRAAKCCTAAAAGPGGHKPSGGEARQASFPAQDLDPDAPIYSHGALGLLQLTGPAGRGPRAKAAQGGCLKEPPYLYFQSPPPPGAQALSPPDSCRGCVLWLLSPAPGPVWQTKVSQAASSSECRES